MSQRGNAEHCSAAPYDIGAHDRKSTPQRQSIVDQNVGARRIDFPGEAGLEHETRKTGELGAAHARGLLYRLVGVSPETGTKPLGDGERYSVPTREAGAGVAVYGVLVIETGVRKGDDRCHTTGDHCIRDLVLRLRPPKEFHESICRIVIVLGLSGGIERLPRALALGRALLVGVHDRKSTVDPGCLAAWRRIPGFAFVRRRKRRVGGRCDGGHASLANRWRWAGPGSARR